MSQAKRRTDGDLRELLPILECLLPYELCPQVLTVFIQQVLAAFEDTGVHDLAGHSMNLFPPS